MSDEAQALLGGADRRRGQAARVGGFGGGYCPKARDRGADVLPLEEAVWRSGAVGGLCELKQLREENAKHKRLVADLSLDKVMLQDITEKKW